MRSQPEAIPLVEHIMYQSQQRAFSGVVPGVKADRVDDLEAGISPFECESRCVDIGTRNGLIYQKR